MISEIFASIQGEGPWTGERHIFVRFIGCDIACRYCDTAEIATPESARSKFCQVQSAVDISRYKQVPNPISDVDLTAICTRFIIPGPSRPTLSLTGGEPLLHCSFLAQWLPTVRKNFRIYLETNGLHAGAMHDIRDMIDVVSMDFKLPSSTGLRSFWEEHKQFLSAAQGKKLFVKSVVTTDTQNADIVTAARIIAEFDRSVIFILQPAGGQHAPATAKLIEFQRAALEILEDVRVIPQTHKVLDLP